MYSLRAKCKKAVPISADMQKDSVDAASAARGNKKCVAPRWFGCDQCFAPAESISRTDLIKGDIVIIGITALI
jgi:hypothetical protein